jgi:hypothetical protein
MNTQAHGTQTFARQPTWNSSGAVGAIAGLVLSPFVSAKLLVMPWLVGHHHLLAANVAVCGILGACIGMVIGAIADRNSGRNN